MNKPIFKVGDQIKVFTKDPQDNKVHPTPFEGLVIALRGGGENQTFTVRKIASDKVAVERIFSIGAPTIESIKVIKYHQVRRAKLYYLRKKQSI